MSGAMGHYTHAVRCVDCGDGFPMRRNIEIHPPGVSVPDSIVCRGCGCDKWERAVGRKVPHLDYRWWNPLTWSLPNRWEWRGESKKEPTPSLIPLPGGRAP